MHERRRNSKWLPEIFLLLQIVAMLLFSYVAYVVLGAFGMPKQLLLAALVLGNVLYLVKFYSRYTQVVQRTKYMEYT